MPLFRVLAAAAGLVGLLAGAAFAQDSSSVAASTLEPLALYTPQGVGKQLVVVELYTSQGCSSCPPADQLLADLTARDDVLPLTLPITYWDKLGWRDTLARPIFTERQMDYAKHVKKGQVYTPQMVIDGLAFVVGSRREKVIERIAVRHQTKQESKTAEVPITIGIAGDTVRVAVAADPEALARINSPQATVWLFPFARARTVPISKGENRGRSIRYSHVVTDIINLGHWTGEQIELSGRLSKRNTDAYAYAAILQANRIGPILGSAWVSRGTEIDPATITDPEPSMGMSPLYVTLPR